MSDTTLADFPAIAVGTASRDALSLFEDLLLKEQDAIDTAAFAELGRGNLTPERAMVLFAEKHSLHRILRRLRQRDQSGQSAARRLASRELS